MDSEWLTFLSTSHNNLILNFFGGIMRTSIEVESWTLVRPLERFFCPWGISTSLLSEAESFIPNTEEVSSDGPESIACWFIDTDYNEESFFVRHAYFLGANDPYSALKTTLKAEIDPDAWATLHSDTSRPFDKPKSGRIAAGPVPDLPQLPNLTRRENVLIPAVPP